MHSHNSIYKAPESDLTIDKKSNVSYKRKYAIAFALSFPLWLAVVVYANSTDHLPSVLLASLVLATFGSISVVLVPSNKPLIYLPSSVVLQLICAYVLGKWVF